MRYKVGKIGMIKDYGKHNIRKELKFNDVLSKNCSGVYNSQYKGMTAVFKQLYGAHKLRTIYLHDCSDKLSYKLIIIQIILTGTIYDGNYIDENVYIGSEIKSIKKIKE